MKKKLFLIPLAIIIFIPFPTVTVPEWKLQYVDLKGRPVEGLPLSQTWQNYSIESHDSTSDGVTDYQGNVVFSEHKSWAPIIGRIFLPILNFMQSGVHASFGSSSWVISRCDVKEIGDNAAVYWGQPLPDKIVIGYDDRSHIRNLIPGALPLPEKCKTIDKQLRDASL